MIITAILAIIIVLLLLRFSPPLGSAISQTDPTPVPVAQVEATPTEPPSVTVGPPDLNLPDREFEVGEIELGGFAPGVDKVQVVVDGEVCNPNLIFAGQVLKLPLRE